MNRTLLSFPILLVCIVTSLAGIKPINVADFGAKGDGVTDDTAAIQAAFAKAVIYGWHGGPEVFFPYGTYLVTDELNAQGIAVRGEGYATILQKNKDKDIFHAKQAWRMTISGLTFVGGRNQISLGNANTDTGFLQVIDCRFKNAGGYAIETRPGSNSSVVLIEKCHFFHCEQAFIHNTDEGIFRDSWITSASMTNKAVIVASYGRLLIENVCGVPSVNGTDQRWIDFHGGWLTVRNFRFGGEAAGFTPIVSWAKPVPYLLGHSISLDSSSICSLGNAKRQCAIYCEEIPNQILVRDCRLAGVPVLQVRPTIDPKTYFQGVQPGMLSFTIEDCVGERGGELPDWLKRPATPPAAPGGEGQLSTEQTATQLAALVEAERKRKPAPPAEPVAFNGHTRQTDPARFMKIPFDAGKWSLDDLMDATSEKNSEYLAVAPADERVILLRRKRGGWPHVLIRDIRVDLDKFPFLALQRTRTDAAKPASDAVRLIDPETQQALVLYEGGDPYAYRAFNLRELLKATGTRTISLKYYFLGGGPPGDSLVIDAIRLEAAE